MPRGAESAMALLLFHYLPWLADIWLALPRKVFYKYYRGLKNHRGHREMLCS